MNALLTLNAISKTYHLGSNQVKALRCVDFVMMEGEFTALRGPSGSGKSTLLNICGLLDQFDEGTYYLGGIDINTLTKQELTLKRRKKIGFIFQGFNLIHSITVFENVEYPLLLGGVATPQRWERTLSILEQVGLKAFADHLPEQLSGEQRQRVAIARALVKKPPLVIADEPTAHLDTDTAVDVIDLMRILGRDYGTTFLIATHDKRMATRCDRTLQLTDGVLHEMI